MLVPDQGLGHDPAGEAGLACPQAEIRFLVDQEEPLVDQADLLEDLPGDHHAAAVDDLDGIDPRRVGSLDGDDDPLEEAGRFGVIEPAAVGQHGLRLVHGADDRADDAAVGMVPGRRQQAVDDPGGHGRVVVEQQHPVGALLQSVANAGVIAAGPAAVVVAPDDGCPGVAWVNWLVGSGVEALSTTIVKPFSGLTACRESRHLSVSLVPW